MRYVLADDLWAAMCRRSGTRSRAGGVRFRIEAGPPGLAVDVGGVVRWAVSVDAAGPAGGVKLTVSAASGREMFHAFKLAVVAAAGERKPASKE